MQVRLLTLLDRKNALLALLVPTSYRQAKRSAINAYLASIVLGQLPCKWLALPATARNWRLRLSALLVLPELTS